MKDASRILPAATNGPNRSGRPGSWAPTLGAVWMTVPALLTLIYVSTLVQYPLDFWNHLCAGRLIWQEGAIPHTDPGVFTLPGVSVVYQNWLIEAVLYGAYRIGGIAAAEFLIAACYAAAIGVVTWHARLRGAGPRVAAGLALGSVALAVSNFGMRPQSLSMLLFALELLVLWQWPGRWATVVTVGLIEVVWTNVHGAFPLGIVVPGIFLTGALWERARRSGLRSVLSGREVQVYAAAVLVAAVAAFANPTPGKTMDYVLGVASRASQRQIGEWHRTATWSYTAVAFFASLPLAAWVAWVRRREWRAVEWLLLIAFVGLGLTAQRMVVWWALVLPSLLAPHLRAIVQQWQARRGQADSTPEVGSWANAVMLGVLLVMVGMSTPWTRFYNPTLPANKRAVHPGDEPCQVVAVLAEQHYRGRVFQPLEWGSYLVWHLAPEVQVFIDTWVDFYPDAVWDDYRRIGNAEPGWEETLRRYDVGVVAWNKRLESRLPEVLAASPDWRKLHEDGLCVVFVRREGR